MAKSEKLIRKEKSISRTIELTYASVYVFNADTMEVKEHQTECLIGKYENEKDFLHDYRILQNADAVKVTNLDNVEVLVKMHESDFFRMGELA